MSLRGIIWNWIARPLFRCTPHAAYEFRRQLLRLCGARLGRRVRCRRSVDIDQPWNIRFDDLVMVSDPEPVGHPPVRGPIAIAEDCWIATDTLVLPGSTLEAGVVVGARGMVSGRIEAWHIATGEPARPRRERVLYESA